VARGVFIGRTHVDQVHDLLAAALHHAQQTRDVQVPHAIFGGELRGVGFSRGHAFR
jgi:hypothetical protein